MTLAAANGGGDTVVANVPRVGGWGPDTVLVVTVGATPTVVTVDGVAQPSVTSGTIAVPISGGVYAGRAVPVTYNQVTNVTVGAQRLS